MRGARHEPDLEPEATIITVILMTFIICAFPLFVLLILAILADVSGVRLWV